MLHDAVRRDLEWLLNTRRIAVPPDEGLQGAQPFRLRLRTARISPASACPHRADRTKLIRQLQNTVKLFEPRIAKFAIVPLEAGRRAAATLRFRIEGLLLMDPEPEHVSFDTVLQLTSGQYEVQNAG